MHEFTEVVLARILDRILVGNIALRPPLPRAETSMLSYEKVGLAQKQNLTTLGQMTSRRQFCGANSPFSRLAAFSAQCFAIHGKHSP